MVSDIKRDIPKFDTVLLHSNWSNLRQKYLSKIRDELWAKCTKDFGNFGRHFPYATSAKIFTALHSMYARVPQGMAQFVLKIEKLSHIMGTTPVLAMARAYGVSMRALHTAGAPEIRIYQSRFSRREKFFCPDVNVSKRNSIKSRRHFALNNQEKGLTIPKIISDCKK